MPTPAELAAMCRCGHARRFHLRGTIWQGYETTCQIDQHGGEYQRTGCMFFERADTMLVMLRRRPDGRFEKVSA